LAHGRSRATFTVLNRGAPAPGRCCLVGSAPRERAATTCTRRGAIR
jgi:hypothetical protein